MFLNFCLDQWQLYDSKQCLFMFILFYTINYSLRKKLYVLFMLTIVHVIIYIYTNEYKKLNDNKKNVEEYCENIETVVPTILYTLYLLFFSVLGIVTSMLASFYVKIPNSRIKISLKNRNKLMKNILEFVFLFSSFYQVDKQINQTQFPIGIYRTYLIFILIQFTIYIINKNSETLKEFNCHNTKKNHYDFIYMHWIISTSYFFVVHLAIWKHSCFITIMAACIFILSHALYSINCNMYSCKLNKQHSV